MGVKSINFKVGISRNYFDTEARKFKRSVKRTFRSIGKLAGNLGVQLGAGLLVREIGKMTIAFETSMTKIETLVGLSAKQVEGFKNEVLELSSVARKSPQELSEALFTVTSAGIRGAEAMDVLERAAQASRIGLGETKEIARTTTAVLQAYGAENITAARATDILVATVREGNLEASELAPVLGRVLGSASKLGISFEEVGASIATFTRLGVDSSEAVVGLRGIMNALIKPSQQGRQALEEVGLSFADLRMEIDNNGLADTLIRLVKLFEGNDEGLAQIIPNVRALSTVLGTAGVQGDAYREILDNITDSTGMLDESITIVAGTVEDKLNKSLVELNKTAIEIGVNSMPYVTNALDKLNKVLADDSGLLDSEGLTLSFEFLDAVLFGVGIQAEKTTTSMGKFAYPLPGIAKDAKEAAQGLALLGFGVSKIKDAADPAKPSIKGLSEQIADLNNVLEEQSQVGNIQNSTLEQYIKLTNKAKEAQKDLADAIERASGNRFMFADGALPHISGGGLSQMVEPGDDVNEADTTYIDTMEDKMNDLHDSIVRVREAYMSVSSVISQLASNSQAKTDGEIKGIEKEIEAINERYNLETEQINESISNNRLRGNALTSIEDERKQAVEVKEKEITKIRNKELRKQAIANKATSLVESIINTALGVTKALSMANPILAGIIGGMGSAQSILIASQQIPSFATGGAFSGGMALVGERGPELIKTSGASKVYNNRQSAGMLASGRELFTNVDGTGFMIWFREQERMEGGR